jgi:Uma2 family endonuclease
MDQAEGASVLSLCPDLPRHRWTVDDYHRMGEVGLLDPDDRVELIEGDIVEMAPIGDGHADASNRLTRVLDRERRSQGA